MTTEEIIALHIEQYEEKLGRKLSESEKQMFSYAMEKGMEVAENIGTYL